MPMSKRNRRGVFWLLIIGTCIVITPRIVTNAFGNEEISVSYTEEQLIEANNEIVSTKKQRFNRSKKKTRYKRSFKKFDPNDYEVSDWMKLGLSEKQSAVVLKFTSKGIRKKEDLQKIFVFPNQLFELIKDSIEIKSIPEYAVKRDGKQIEKEVVIVDINIASAEELEEVPGIGPYFSKKIIERRESLGGFIGKHQLLEVWKFDAEKLNSIKDYILISEEKIKTLNINSLSIDDLKAHPYIDFSVANAIVKYRNQHGTFSEVSDCKKIRIIDQELFEKLEPYLSVK